MLEQVVRELLQFKVILELTRAEIWLKLSECADKLTRPASTTTFQGNVVPQVDKHGHFSIIPW